MKKTILIIAAILVVVYFVISIVKGIWNPLQWFASTDYDDCVAKNKALANGAPCSNCVQGQGASFSGTITDGICIPPKEDASATVYKITVSKQGGARTYVQQADGSVVAPAGSAIVPFGTQTNATIVQTPTANYYKTSYGLLDANDISINNNSAH